MESANATEKMELEHPDGDTIEITHSIVYECDDCERTWTHQVGTEDVTCPVCGGEPDRTRGFQYDLVTRYDSISGDGEPIEFDEAYDRLNRVKRKIEALEHEGWNLTALGTQGTFLFSSPEAPNRNRIRE